MRVRLVLWTVGLALAGFGLLAGVTWPTGEEPATATMAVVRVVAGVLALYLLCATIVSVVAAVRWRRSIGPVVVRRLVAAAIGSGLLIAPAVASAESGRAPTTEAPVLRRLPEATPVDPRPIVAPQPQRQVEPTVDEITVVPGDHLWRIAERTLEGRLGRPPSDGEIVPYWRQLIERNRSRLLSPDDPDLIVPGQTFVLP